MNDEIVKNYACKVAIDEEGVERCFCCGAKLSSKQAYEILRKGIGSHAEDLNLAILDYERYIRDEFRKNINE